MESVKSAGIRSGAFLAIALGLLSAGDALAQVFAAGPGVFLGRGDGRFLGIGPAGYTFGRAMMPTANGGFTFYQPAVGYSYGTQNGLPWRQTYRSTAGSRRNPALSAPDYAMGSTDRFSRSFQPHQYARGTERRLPSDLGKQSIWDGYAERQPKYRQGGPATAYAQARAERKRLTAQLVKNKKEKPTSIPAKGQPSARSAVPAPGGEAKSAESSPKISTRTTSAKEKAGTSAVPVEPVTENAVHHQLDAPGTIPPPPVKQQQP